MTTCGPMCLFSLSRQLELLQEGSSCDLPTCIVNLLPILFNPNRLYRMQAAFNSASPFTCFPSCLLTLRMVPKILFEKNRIKGCVLLKYNILYATCLNLNRAISSAQCLIFNLCSRLSRLTSTISRSHCAVRDLFLLLLNYQLPSTSHLLFSSI